METPVTYPFRHPRAETKVKALGFGADDYLTQPFQKDELVACIHALVHRSR